MTSPAASWVTRLPRADAVMLVTAALVYGVVAQGAFYPTQAITLALLSIAAAVASRTALPRLAVIAFATLTVGIGTSWLLEPAGDPRIAISVVAIAASATVIGASQRGRVRALAGLLVAVGAAAALVGIVGAAWHLEPIALEAQRIWRAASLLTYANSLGAFLVPCLAAGALRLRDRDLLIDRLGVAAIVAGLIASLSRAAMISLAIGLIVAFVVDRREAVRAVLACRLALVAGAIGGLATLPAIFGEPAPVIAIAGLAVAGVCCLAPTASRAGTVLLAAAAVALVAGSVATIATGHVDGFAERLANEDRARIWNVSWDAGVDALPTGQGLERFRVIEIRHERAFRIRFAHNEALQALVETGYVGPIAYAAASVLLGIALWSRRHGNELALAVAAAYATHGMLDFVWHVPVVALLAFLFVGVALGEPITDDASADAIGATEPDERAYGVGSHE